MQPTKSKLWAAVSVCAILVLLAATSPTAQNTITNGAGTEVCIDGGATCYGGLVIPAFLFEPEVAFTSLKEMPVWNELEQLLDNPYATVLCSSAYSGLTGNTPGTAQGWPSICTTTTFTRRPSFGVSLPPLLVHPLNYNPTTGEYMRLLNPSFPGGTWQVADTLTTVIPDQLYAQQYRTVSVSPGEGRVEGHAIDYNSPLTPDTPACITGTELVPPEGAQLCGGDTGEPGSLTYLSAEQQSARRNQYSNLATAALSKSAPGNLIEPGTINTPITARSFISGVGGLGKPSITVPPIGTQLIPGYTRNTDPNDVVASNENDYLRCDSPNSGVGLGACTFANKQQARLEAATLGKALFWDMQVGSDAVQSCGSCHAHAGADNRVKNQMNPNHLSGDINFEARQPNDSLIASDFPLHKLSNPDIAGDPKCTTPIQATVNAGVLENTPGGVTGVTVCDAGNIARTTNDVASSMGVHFGLFKDIPPIGTFSTNAAGVRSVVPDLRSDNPLENVDPIPGFQGSDGSGHGIRRVEPRNTPTVFMAAVNFDNFWDGRARHDFNGGSVFGAADPQTHVFVDAGSLTATRQIIRFSSLGSLATGPGLSEFEMSLQGRNWAKIGKKLLQANITPLANQLVAVDDSFLGRYSNQGGSACASVPAADRSPGTPAAGKPGLCISYRGLIRRAYHPLLWRNTNRHLNGCYTDGNPTLHPNQCAASVPKDPFDGYVLSAATSPAAATDTNQFTQMEGNFSLFWGLSVNLWAQSLVPDDTPFDRFLDANPDAFRALGEPNEPGLVDDLPACTSATERDCFRPVGNFQRNVPAGSRDPLLGMDLFFASNLSLKNPNFRTGRCGECHAAPTLTDNTMPFTVKAQLGDFIPEFVIPGSELLKEPLGRMRVISGFLLESELGENGQDGVERRIANQSIAPNAVDGLAYPDGLFAPDHINAGQSFFDNGVYNLGVTACEADYQGNVIGQCDDIGRGGDDAFGWPLSLATLMLKNLGGPDFEPGNPLPTFTCANDPCDEIEDATGGLFEESAQDENINPGFEGEAVNPLLPAYLAPWTNEINVGDAHPDLDEVDAGPNTLTDVAILEGFTDVLGPINPAGTLNEAYNNADQAFMGTWPVVNRVGRAGSFKAAQLREVDLTGPYFHNGGKLTLRQVVDFYSRGGDFPVTNANHRDFNILNLNIEVQSNLTEEEKVAIVDFLLELTDDRVLYERAPFDHPEVILPLDGTAPENTTGRDAMLGQGLALADDCTLPNGGTPSALGPGHRVCAGGMFLDVPAVGAGGSASPLPRFLGLSDERKVGGAAFCGDAATSQYCR
jgi:cytochrome c peroxidase